MNKVNIKIVSLLTGKCCFTAPHRQGNKVNLLTVMCHPTPHRQG